MKATCQFCGNRWFLTPEALALAVENSPKKGKSIGVECPRCRKMVKIARPKDIPQIADPPAEEES
ncbi:MAG: hypothetical protein J5I90_07560 [Caldilineales bacterium]|nr:hypothetical protein [Caldilineales bacterium]